MTRKVTNSKYAWLMSVKEKTKEQNNPHAWVQSGILKKKDNEKR